MEKKSRLPKNAGRELLIVLSAMLVGAMACSLFPPTSVPQTAPPATRVPPTPHGQEPTLPTRIPPSPQPTASVLRQISGMWSGCPPTSGGEVVVQPCTLTASGYPLGPFITLFILPDCNIGDPCGKYVKGAFESEFIDYLLTLTGYDGEKALFYADPGGGMFEGMETNVEVSRVGPMARIAEASGGSYLLPTGCDPVIDSNFQCIDDVP